MKGNYESLTSLAQEIERQEKVKNDYLVSTTAVSMIDPDQISIEGVGDFSVNDNAHSQIAARLNIPRKYYDRMTEVEGLREYNVNALMHEKPERRMVRTLDGTTRAFLSNSFKPYDNFDILKTALPVLQEFPDLQVKSQSLTDTRMYLQIMFPTLKSEITVGDVVNYGITLRNSEVGHSSVAVESTVWRLVCQNGMISSSLLKKYHAGRRVNEDASGNIYQSDTISADIRAFQLQLRDILKSSLTQDKFEEILNPMRDATERKIEKPQAAVENITERFGLTKNESELTSRNLIRSGELTQWSMANSITALAHDLESPDRQYEVEKMGAEIITLKDHEWEKLTA